VAQRDWAEWHRDYDDPGSFDVSRDGFMSVGAHRLTGEPVALTPGQRLFTFAART
jgi:hypothetical protein